MPVATLVTPPISKVYFTGENLDFDVTFDSDVEVAGTPVLPLTIGAATPNASYLSGSGTDTLTFRYTIQSADQDVDGITVDPASITGTITDAAGNAADFSSVPAPSTVAVIVNPVIINSVTPSTNADYTESDTITLTANFDSAVSVTGTPRIELTLDSGTVFADFASGSGTTALVFNYSVQAGDLDTDGIALTSPIDLNGGAIEDAGGNAAVLTFTPPTLTGVLVDAIVPVATLITPPGGDSYFTASDLTFVVTFDSDVEVTGTPALPLTIGSTTRNASYVGGNGTNTLTFRYTIQSADQDVDGITVDPASITGTITDAAGNAADFSSVPAPSTVAVIVNPVIINSVTPSADGDYKEGDTIALTANFTEAVSVTGTPRIELTLDSGTVFADYASGSGTTDIVFSYTVQSGDEDTNGITLTSPIDLNSGAIQDASLNDAELTFTPQSNSVLVDGLAPVADA